MQKNIVALWLSYVTSALFFISVASAVLFPVQTNGDLKRRTINKM